MTTYPLEALAAHLGITLGQTGGHQPGQDPTGIAALVDRLGISTTRVHQLRRAGLTADQADRYACAVGAHPSWIWPAWWSDAPEELPPAAARNAAKTRCPRGHTYDHLDHRGYRICRTCRAENRKKCRQERKAAGQPTRPVQMYLPGIQS